MKFAITTAIVLAQSALCDNVLQAREAKVTAAAVLLDRRADSNPQCNAGKTACGDGNGCCPQGSKCTSNKGVGMCADSCAGATLYCDFGNGVNLCCQPGASCDYSRSVCTQHSTDQGGVWTLASTTTDGTSYSPLPTAPVFTSTSGQGDDDSSSSSSAQSSPSSGGASSPSSSSSAAGGSLTTGGATTTPTPTKNPNSGSAVVTSWSVGVLAAVFGVMAAL